MRDAADAPLCPEARRSSPVVEHDGRPVLNLDSYVPHLLGAVNNPLSAGASAVYLARFGIGVVEWRVISTLMIEPGIPASRIAAVFAGDRGAVSRALRCLHDRGLATFEAPAGDPRRRVWTLSEEGRDLHGRIISIALERERRLIAGVDPDDLEAFLRAMRIMRRNVAALRPDAPALHKDSED